MALLPLAAPAVVGLAGYMSTVIRRAAEAAADLVREFNYAQRRLTELRVFGRDPDRAPATYSEFLFRSPVALWREPSARRRRSGALPCR
jgi:hypothetical protein